MEMIKKLLFRFFKPPIKMYLLLTAAFFIALQTVNFCLETDIANYYPIHHLRRLADAMMLAIPAIFLCRRKWWLYLYVWLTDVYLLAVVWYYRTYLTVMPLSALTQFENLNGLGPSILHSMRLTDLGILLPPLVFAAYHNYTTRKGTNIEGGGIPEVLFALL